MFHYFLQLNFATILISFFMLIFVNVNPVFQRKVIRLFSIAISSVLCLVIVDSIEYWCATLPYPTMLRVAVSIIGYALRPINICFVIILSCGNRVSQKFKKFIALPGILNTLIALTALFSGVCFSYSDKNEFVRGPLGYSAFAASGFYLILLVILTNKLYKMEHTYESLTAIFIAVTNTIAVILEAFFHYDGLINTTGAVSVAFYYMYLTTQQFKRDPLTCALNRRYFYLDADHLMESKCLTAVISIDLNDLKRINDENGHAAGDTALCTIVACIQNILPRGCHLYRTGGDEFMILCSRVSKDDVPALIDHMRRELSKTLYCCAIGFATPDADEDFEHICSIADAAMYVNKKQLKGEDTIR